LRYGLLGLGVLAMVAFFLRLFRRFRGQEPQWIESHELQRRMSAGDRVMLLDVRQPDEFNAPPGHLPSAVNVPLTDLTGRMSELARRRQPIVVVCKTDRRSARAAADLLAFGLKDVSVLRGGTDGWHQRGLALE
jgi:rhodanese-related sulfurtransferase